MWSASSMTVTSTASSDTWPWPMRSSSRPGQATTTSTPRRSAETCGPWPTPPKTVREVRPRRWARGVIASSIWATSSRVGARMSARGRRACGRFWLAARRVSSGSTKAIVLPEPVRPRPSTSRPARESGSVAAWMGVGVVIPPAARTSTREAGTPSVPKFWEDKEISFMVHGVVATVVVGVDSGCSAGRGSGPRRRVTGGVPTRRHRHQRSRGPRQKAGHCRPAYATPLSTPASRPPGRVGCWRGSRGDHLSTQLRQGLPAGRRGSGAVGPVAPTVTYAVAAAVPAGHRPAPRRPAAAAAVRAALPGAGAVPRRAARRTTGASA